MTDIHRGTSHGDGELRSMKSPGAPTCRGAAVLRLDGQHTGRARFPTAHLYIAGTTQGSIQGGRESEVGHGVLTLVGGVVVAGSVEWRSVLVSLLCLGLLVRRGTFLLPRRPVRFPLATSGPRSSPHGAAEARRTPPPLLPARLRNRRLGKTTIGRWEARMGSASG
jgi:hypothetical protein